VGILTHECFSGSESLVARGGHYQGLGFSFFINESGLRSFAGKALLYFEEVCADHARDRLFKIVNLLMRASRLLAEEEGRRCAKRIRVPIFYFLWEAKMSSDSVHQLFLVYPEANWVEIGLRHAVIRSSAIPASVNPSWNAPDSHSDPSLRF